MDIHKTKARIIDGIIAREGGYSNHKSDSGGKTRYGITEKLAREYGYIGPISSLPRETAVEIYSKEFWEPLRLQEIAALSEMIAEEIMDTAVNCGPCRAATFLQKALNSLNDRGRLYGDILVDGDLGPITLKALASYLRSRATFGSIVMLRALNALQGAHYLHLAEARQKDEAFVFGWLLNRVS